MASLVSPGVQVKEIDLTNVVPSTSSTVGAIAGSFAWGPCDVITTVSSETELIDKFGKPGAETFETTLQAAQFLSDGSALRAVRAVGSSALNATASGTGILTKKQRNIRYANTCGWRLGASQISWSYRQCYWSSIRNRPNKFSWRVLVDRQCRIRTRYISGSSSGRRLE